MGPITPEAGEQAASEQRAELIRPVKGLPPSGVRAVPGILCSPRAQLVS